MALAPPRLFPYASSRMPPPCSRSPRIDVRTPGADVSNPPADLARTDSATGSAPIGVAGVNRAEGPAPADHAGVGGVTDRAPGERAVAGLSPLGLAAAFATAFAGGLALASFLSPPALAAESFRSYQFEVRGRAVQIPSMVVPGEPGGGDAELISLRGAAAALGGRVKPLDTKGSFLFDLENAALRFSCETPSLVKWGDHIVSLSSDARVVPGDLYLPLDFLTRVVEPVLRSAQPASETAHQGAGALVLRTRSTTSVPSLFPSVETAIALPGLTARTGGRTGGDSPLVLAKDGIRTIVLDPGHGGEETGAAGKTGIFEKEITLDVAKRLKALLEKETGVRVLLTRDEDATVGLDERPALANQNHADLFLSIHVNSAPRRDARGAETYFLASKAKDEESRTLAAIENNTVGVDRTKLGSDPGNLELVLWDLAQSQYLEESSELAEVIQKELDAALGVKDRGIKQAPFRVLMGATMPAVLVEVGFITNPAEETVLKTDEYRDKIAQALSRAVSSFHPGAARHLAGAPAAAH